MVSEFENQKRTFSNSKLCSEMIINIPGIKAQPRYKVEDGWVPILREDIEDLFTKIVGPIIKSIEQQILLFNDSHGQEGYSIEHVIFVGGLSRNAHVLSSLKSHFKNVEIITPQPGTATLISKGAILLALHPDWVGERVLRCSLGFVQDEEFDPAVHTEPEDKHTHDGDKVQLGCWNRVDMVLRRIKWLFAAVGSIFIKQISFWATDNIQGQSITPGASAALIGYIGAECTGDIHITEKLYSSKTDTIIHLPVRALPSK